MSSAFVTGITGKGSAYHARILLDKSYTGYGVFRRTSSVSFCRLEELGGAHPKNTLEQLCQMMAEADLRRIEKGFVF